MSTEQGDISLETKLVLDGSMPDMNVLTPSQMVLPFSEVRTISLLFHPLINKSCRNIPLDMSR